MTAQRQYKPGEIAEVSGIVGVVGPRGGKTTVERTVVKGEPHPPTPKAGQSYVPIRPANNGSGKKK